MNALLTALMSLLASQPWVKETAVKVAVGLAVGWLVTAGGCSVTGRASVWWAKRQAYKQGKTEGYDQGLADGLKECGRDGEQGRRRWRLFTEPQEPTPWLGPWYGVTDTYCVDGKPVEVEPERAVE